MLASDGSGVVGRPRGPSDDAKKEWEWQQQIQFTFIVIEIAVAIAIEGSILLIYSSQPQTVSQSTSYHPLSHLKSKCRFEGH